MKEQNFRQIRSLSDFLIAIAEANERAEKRTIEKRACKNCKHSYPTINKNEARCVYHDKYPKVTDTCYDWEERSEELINREMALEAIADAKTLLQAFAAVIHLPEADEEWRSR